MRSTVESDHRHPMLHVANQRIQNRIQLAVVPEMAYSRSSGLNHHGQRQRLPACICIEREPLRHSVVGDHKVVRREPKHLSA